jgi:protein-tyrosine phosphatase
MENLHNVTLLQPVNGSVTAPLQRYRWPAEVEGGNADEASASWDALEETSEDRSVPAPVVFVWEATVPASKGVQYEFTISSNRDLKDPLTLSGLTHPRAEVSHLHLGTRYFWKAEARANGTTLAESPVGNFTTSSATPRWIEVPGITNVRDLGGWPLPGGNRVRQGRVYRSSEMNRHVEITDEGTRVLLDDLGIRTDLDLRGVGGEALPALDPDRVRWINVPIRPYECIADDEGRLRYLEVFRVFADPANYPILFHCWGGADRAGTVALLLSALLGVSRDDLICDYELTSLSIWGPRLRSSDEFTALLDALRSFGPDADINEQAENYLLTIGITADEITGIRSCLVEEGLQ